MLDRDHTGSIDSAKRNTLLTVCLWRRVSSVSSTGCSRARTFVPSVIFCRFDVLAGALFVIFAGVVGCGVQHSDRQVNGHQLVHCWSLRQRRLRRFSHTSEKRTSVSRTSRLTLGPLGDSSSFEALLPSFDVSSTMAAIAVVSASGTGRLLRLQRPVAIFPKTVLANRHCRQKWKPRHSREVFRSRWT